jgi:Acetylornithine deacetylase/Succinyl-diaminopimelate desuccinylase and related deacylases
MLANTVSITVLKAGYKTNVIPAECSAELDCRLLPGVKPDDFVKEVKDILQDESVEVKILDWEKAEPSPFGSDFVKAVIAANKMESKNSKSQAEIPVVPVIVPWFTDSHWFRDLGIKAYGFEPVEIDPEHMATMHGKDERIPVEGLRKGTERLIRIIYLLSGPGQ